ncbi:MAG: hypothetical protein JO154_06415 [Chitinophaga sp.]|uniref:hypothetical protein n=1 Tax=Chitinophaga sp. TaxID=1869181 RepID=UPI0025BA070E|nr:hypothetical protein [Chitinophaga sp.]MBV8252226.1 hypothetical protein [Chitinophaga sp.]
MKSRRQEASVKPTTELADEVPNGADEVYTFTNASKQPTTLVGPDGGYNVNFATKILETLYFPTRRTQVQILIPYYARMRTNGTLYGVSLNPGFYPQILPLGPYWGEVTQGNGAVTGGNSINVSPTTYLAPISGYSTAQEKRTQIVSMSGQIKISTNLNLAVFTVGSELEAGFTIQRAEYIYNNYVLDFNGDIVQDSPSSPVDPQVHFRGTISCKGYGVLQN